MLIERTKDKVIRLELHKVLAYFLVFGFFGWIFETLVVWIEYGRFTCRGYIFQGPVVWGLPLIELYGFGGVIMAVLFGHWKSRPVKLFLAGMTAMTLLELVGSYLCTSILKTQYWDYTNNFMNFNGRICLSSSIAWGTLSVIGVSVVMPQIDRYYHNASDKKYLKINIIILILYAVFCAVFKYLIA